MSSVNVIPSAPSYDEADLQETQRIYPALPTQDAPDNFRMQKINEISTTLSQEVSHYRAVAKKYQKAKTILHYMAVGSGAISGVLSSASVASALTGIGLIASVPLGIVAAIFGISSASLTGVCKKLEPKKLKHREIVTLAIAKRETVNRLVSKALTDKKVSDVEFQLILNELASYFALKEKEHKTIKTLSEKNISPPPDLVKLREEIRQEEKQKLKKRLSAVSSSDLKE